MEIWKEIPGYERLYEASSLGRIRSVDGKITSNAQYEKRVWKQRIMKQKYKIRNKLKGNKDARVCLWKDGKEKTYLVSRLIATTFIGDGSGMTVNHKDGNSANNRADNLEWITKEENIRHAFDNGLCDNFCVKTTLVNSVSGERKSFRSMSEASKWLGRSCGYISNNYKAGRKLYSRSGVEYFLPVLGGAYESE